LAKKIFLFNLIIFTILFGLLGSGKLVFSEELWVATSTTNAPSARDNHTAIWTGTKMIIWGGGTSLANVNSGGQYDPAANSWTTTSITNAPSARFKHTAIWTGGQMIIWGGYSNNNPVNTGGIYDPAANTWTTISTANAPSPRYYHLALWTGSKMIVWGGIDANGNGLNTGGIYDPVTNSWTTISSANAPSSRWNGTIIWTGTKAIVWGGWSGINGGSIYYNTGGVYDPETNVWTLTSLVNAPEGRASHSAVWTGAKMIIWSGATSAVFFDNGGIYDPSTDTWTPTSTANQPVGRAQHIAVLTDINKMVIWGGNILAEPFCTNTGGIYTPSTNTWVSTTITNAPESRLHSTAVWAGEKMIVWGGFNTSNYLNSGGVYSNSIITGTINNLNNVAEEFSLFQNYPNPFNPSTKIKFDIPSSSFVTLAVYNSLGEEITRLVNTELNAGSYEVSWNASGNSSGIYYYKMIAGNSVLTRKMIIIK
jgi:N-acetylneuraminic acid mutarotase